MHRLCLKSTYCHCSLVFYLEDFPFSCFSNTDAQPEDSGRIGCRLSNMDDPVYVNIAVCG